MSFICITKGSHMVISFLLLVLSNLHLCNFYVMLLPSYSDVQFWMNLDTYLLNTVSNVQASLQKKNVCNISTLGRSNIQNRKITHAKQKWYIFSRHCIHPILSSFIFSHQNYQSCMMEDSSWLWRVAHYLMCPHFLDSLCQLRCLIRYHWCPAWTHKKH